MQSPRRRRAPSAATRMNFVYDDRRRLSGDPIDGLAAAAGGYRAHLRAVHRISNGARWPFGVSAWICAGVAGRTTPGTRRRICMCSRSTMTGGSSIEGRFDEDDFEGAYRELEKRYYAGEGAASPKRAPRSPSSIAGLEPGRLRHACSANSPPPTSASRIGRARLSRIARPSEYRTTLEELDAMVVSVARRGVRPCAGCLRITASPAASGRPSDEDGEHYTWIVPRRLRGPRRAGRVDVRVRARRRGGGVRLRRGAGAGDDEPAGGHQPGQRERPGASGRRCGPATSTARSNAARTDSFTTIGGASAVTRSTTAPRSGPPSQRILEQYTDFELRTLAVRGEHLHLGLESLVEQRRIRDDVSACGRDRRRRPVRLRGPLRRGRLRGRLPRARKAVLRRRGRGVRRSGCDDDRIHDRAERARSRPVVRRAHQRRLLPPTTDRDQPFGDRSAAEFRASVENLHAMVASARSWESAVCWLSPTLAVSRYEREAVGPDGERLRWTHIIVNEIRDGRIESACLFDFDDEDAAFAYAEERVRATTSRLAVTNRASECSARRSGERCGLTTSMARSRCYRGSVRIRRSAATER